MEDADFDMDIQPTDYWWFDLWRTQSVTGQSVKIDRQAYDDYYPDQDAPEALAAVRPALPTSIGPDLALPTLARPALALHASAGPFLALPASSDPVLALPASAVPDYDFYVAPSVLPLSILVDDAELPAATRPDYMRFGYKPDEID